MDVILELESAEEHEATEFLRLLYGYGPGRFPDARPPNWNPPTWGVATSRVMSALAMLREQSSEQEHVPLWGWPADKRRPENCRIENSATESKQCGCGFGQCDKGLIR